MREYIVGAGGGGGKGGGGGSSSPVEEPDSLHSRDSVVVLDALCEGEIFGLVDGLKSVYLNDTPVQNANGSYNFTNLQIGTSNGTQLGVSGSAIMLSIAADVRSEVAVVTRVMQATPVVRRIADLNVNAVDVRVSTPRMVQGDNQGNQSATSINFIIEVNTNGGGYVARVTDTFSGKTTSKYDRTYRLALTGVGPWDIRLTRLSADSTTSLLQNELWFDALTAIISQRLSYPNTALVAMAADARAFQSIPKRSYDIKGLIVRVPSNYNATTRVYTGLWDGTFKLAWTDNPAWCFYDLLTNARYGLGAYLPATAVDKWGLYTIAQYCDALVPNGFGGTEPRFTFNAYITTRAEAFTVVNQLASAFRGMVYWANGTINAVQDAPLDPTALFTRANVIDGAFNYTGASRKAMHTVALVQWNDPANAYQPAIEYVEDAAAIAVYGVIEAQLAAVGCTSRGQAHRLGQWLLYSEKLEQEVITFKSAMDSAYVRPGQIIKVQDAHRAGKRVGGRLASTGSTVSSLTLDAPVTIESGKTYTVAVVLPDGSIGSAPVNNGVGATTSLTLSGIGLAAVPQPNAIWVLTVSDLSPTLWRVLAVAEAAKNEYAITALAHNPSKFSGIENGTALQLPNAVSIPAMPGAPQNITFVENVVKNLGVVHDTLTIGWDSVQYATKYRVSWRSLPGNFTDLPTTSVTNAEVMNIPLGDIEVRVSALNVLGLEGPATVATVAVLGVASSAYAAAVPPVIDPAAPVATVTGELFSTRVSWLFGDSRTDILSTEVWWAGTNDRQVASRIAQVPYPASEYLHVGLQPAQPCYYWLRVVDTSANTSPWYPLLAIEGLYATPIADPSVLMMQLSHSLGVAQLSPELGDNFLAGNVNGVATVGLNGNMVVDGSIFANKINGTNLAVVDGTFSGALSAASGSFSGTLAGSDITGATGTFSGSLSAGTVDITKLIGITTNYFTPGTYTLTVPADKTSMRVTLVGGGGGGGGNRSGNTYGGCGGGGSGTMRVAIFSGLAPGATYSLTVGKGGAENANGFATAIAGLVSAAGGIKGGLSAPIDSGGTGGTGGMNAGGNGGDGGYYGTNSAGASGGGWGGGAGGTKISSFGGGGGGGGGYVSGVSAANGTFANYGYPGAGGRGYGAGGGGAGGMWGYGGAGAGGMAVIEFFNPNGVVIRNEYNELLSALTRQGIATV